jgi:hypothetical protein
MTRTHVGSAALAAVLATMALAGCGGDEPEPVAGSGTPSVSTSGSPSASASASTPEPATTPTTTTPLPDGPLATRLIEPADLPGFNDEWRWQHASTSHTPVENIGTCAKFDLYSIGATEGITRTYSEAGTSDTTSSAAMHVLRFPDAKTAVRAATVLDSWHDTCAERIKPALSPEVGQIQGTGISADRRGWYLVTTTRPGSDEGHFHAFGMSVSGDRMALLTMDNDGQDRNYEAGEDPMELAIAMAADRIR